MALAKWQEGKEARTIVCLQEKDEEEDDDEDEDQAQDGFKLSLVDFVTHVCVGLPGQRSKVRRVGIQKAIATLWRSLWRP